MFDNLNRLYSVTDHHGQVTTYTYDDVGNRETVSYPNGTSTTYVYDALNRLQTMQTVDGSNQIISQFDYTVYPTGHRHTMTDLAGNSSTYMYDELYRLTSETINHVVMGTVVNSYTYDNVGNRDSATENGVTTTYIYDMNDRLVSSTQNGIITTYAYDDNGNTLSKAANGDDTTFTYDARNKLTAAVQHQGGSPVSNVYFEYDIDGNRTQKTDNGNIVNFVVDRNQSYAQVVHETNDQNATQVTYTHGDDLISQDRSASINYYNYDGLGSTRSLTDSAGLITDTYDYNAYGTLLDQSGTSTNSYLYTGEQFDASLDNYYLRARYYDPTVGRFTQLDTFNGFGKSPLSLNKYNYNHGDPINRLDMSGNVSIFQTMAVLGILTTMSNYATTLVTLGRIEDSIVTSKNGWPDGVMISLRGSTGARGFSAGAGIDLIYDYKNKKIGILGAIEASLAPTTMFSRIEHKSNISATSGFIYNMNSMNDLRGIGANATWPLSTVHLLVRLSSFMSNTPLRGFFQQTAKLSLGQKGYSAQFGFSGYSNSGPAFVRIGVDQTAFSWDFFGWSDILWSTDNQLQQIFSGARSNDPQNLLNMTEKAKNYFSRR